MTGRPYGAALVRQPPAPRSARTPCPCNVNIFVRRTLRSRIAICISGMCAQRQCRLLPWSTRLLCRLILSSSNFLQFPYPRLQRMRHRGTAVLGSAPHFRSAQVGHSLATVESAWAVGHRIVLTVSWREARSQKMPSSRNERHSPIPGRPVSAHDPGSPASFFLLGSSILRALLRSSCPPSD